MVANGVLISGMSGGESTTRGFLDGWDPDTGKKLWRHYTIPAPGEPGSETWPKNSDAWTRGGGPTWRTEELSFTRAAERVGIAQPPFSQQIRALEQEMGVRLVDRTPRRVVLTEAGTVFAERARFILSRVGEAVVVTQQIGRGMSGHVCVGFTESGCFHPAVTRTLLEFRQAYPALHVTLQENKSTNLVAMIREGTVDAAFIRPPFEADEVVAYTPLLHEKMVVAVPRGHRLASRKATTLAGLSEEVFVFYHRDVRPGLTDTVIAACERFGLPPSAQPGSPATDLDLEPRSSRARHFNRARIPEASSHE
jgi:DNA-binding transcriptional LysR family regulator